MSLRKQNIPNVNYNKSTCLGTVEGNLKIGLVVK